MTTNYRWQRFSINDENWNKDGFLDAALQKLEDLGWEIFQIFEGFENHTVIGRIPR